VAGVPQGSRNASARQTRPSRQINSSRLPEAQPA
jgi:hypothetical protein